MARPKKTGGVKRQYGVLNTNDLTWKERKQMRDYAISKDYFPGRNYKYMTLTDFIKEFLLRLREGGDA